MDRTLDMPRLIALVALLLAVLLGMQAVADVSVPGATAIGTGDSIGRASFTYLTGLRVFAAQVLWNRIEPLFHDYYGGVALQEQAYMLPTMNMVIALDPQFDQPYYVAAWIISQRGDMETGVDLARRGVENNPDSGLLLSNYAQLLMVQGEGELVGEGRAKALELAESGVSADAIWADEAERFEGYAIFAAVFRLTGEVEQEAATRAEMDRIEEHLGDAALGGEGHDHDQDGVPDH